MEKNSTIESLYFSIQENIELITANYTFWYILRPLILSLIALLGGNFIIFYASFFAVFGAAVLLSGFATLYQCLRYIIFLHFIKIIKGENPIVYKKINSNGDIGNLLESITKIYSIAKYFQSIKAPQIINNHIPNNILQEEWDFLLMRMVELRGELESKFKENISILESAKSEVVSTIKGTSELDQFSDLQKARLDKQIEQFEELQRVLVKM